MSKLSHNKFKNTGLIYECLLRTITHNVLEGIDNNNAINIIKKYFNNKTELSKEYKLYQSLTLYSNINEVKANTIIDSLVTQFQKLNKTSLRKEKYNLIKEIKESYNLDEFFKYKIHNYKSLAALYSLFEANSQEGFVNPKNIINNKYTLLEHLTNSPIDKNSIEDKLMLEYIEMDKGTKLLVYKNFIDKFNKKHSSLLNEQKYILKEYINNGENLLKLKEFVNTQQNILKEKLENLIYQVKDQTIQIKLNEVIELLKPISKTENVKDEDIVSLFSYWELVNEIQSK